MIDEHTTHLKLENNNKKIKNYPLHWLKVIKYQQGLSFKQKK